MKRLILLALMAFSSFAASAQMVWRVIPKTFSDEVGNEHTIVGVQAVFVSRSQIDTVENKNKKLLLSWIEDDGSSYNPRNIMSGDFIPKIMEANDIDSLTAAKAMNKSMSILEYGTKRRVKIQVSLLVGLYGYALE